jgi:hypothetical protein
MAGWVALVLAQPAALAWVPFYLVLLLVVVGLAVVMIPLGRARQPAGSSR